MAAENASKTVPSSAMVVPAMSRHATVIRVIERLLCDGGGTCHATPAWPGDQDNAGLDLSPVVKRISGHAGVHLTVDPGPAFPHPWDRPAEQRLGPGPQVVV